MLLDPYAHMACLGVLYALDPADTKDKKMTEVAQLNELRGMLRKALNMVDSLIAQNPERGSEDDLSRFRQRPGGPLTEAGVAEVTRRFEAGDSDSAIALSMGISLIGVARRRALWRRSKGM